MMSHNLKIGLRYLWIPSLLILLSMGAYLLLGTSVEKYISTQIYAAIEKGNPDYHFTVPIGDKKENSETKEMVKESEIKYPSIGEQYAVLICEDINLNVPFYFGDSEEILEKGIGQYAKSKMPGFGGCILAGGHDSTFLAPLEDIKEGQELILYTDYGNFSYKVRKTKVVETKNVAACQLDSEQEQLVLYTCYPFGEILRARDKRFFVYCDKISGPVVEED